MISHKIVKMIFANFAIATIVLILICFYINLPNEIFIYNNYKSTTAFFLLQYNSNLFSLNS